MAEVIDLEALEWKAIRPGVALGVSGKGLLDEIVKVTYTRVEPGGRFSPHRDTYGHLLCILSGAGFVTVDGRRYELQPGTAVRIVAGEEHHYENAGDDDLLLLTLNFPEAGRT